MSSALRFKVDTANMPRLDSRGSNYTDWQGAYTIVFKYAGLYDIVSGKRKKPEPPTAPAEIDDWDRDNYQAHAMLLSSVHADIVPNITTADSAAKAWSQLRERFDRDTGNSTIYLFRNIANMRYHDGDNLADHVSAFHQLWNKMLQRCRNSSQSLSKTLVPLLENDEIKGTLFLVTLPDTMDAIVDNLSLRDVTSFTSIEPRMLDIAAKHNLKDDDSTAYWTSTASKKRPNNNKESNPRPRPPASTSMTAPLECSWCKKHGWTFVGHLYTDCNKLRKHKDNRKHTPSSHARQADVPDDNGDANDNDNRAVAFAATMMTGKRAINPIILDDDSEDDVIAFSVTAIVAQHTSANQIDDPIAHTHDVAYTTKVPRSTGWIFDTGASRHMSGDIGDFTDMKPCSGHIVVAGGIRHAIDGVGTVRITAIMPDGSTAIRTLSNVLYSKALNGTKLFSWAQIKDKFNMTGSGDNLYLIHNGRYVLWAKHNKVDNSLQIQQDHDASAAFATYREFHEAMGHAFIPNPKLHYKDALVPNRPANFNCEDCSLSKSTHYVPKSLPPNANKPFQLIHSDLSGKFSTPSIGGSWYFVTFIDDCTRHTWVHFLKSKDETLDAYQKFNAMVKTQFNTEVKSLRTDGGGEYVNAKFRAHLDRHSTTHHITPPYSHESNGLAERYNRTIVTDARTCIQDDNLIKLWAEAISNAVYIRNRVPHSTTGKTPHEALFGTKPTITHNQPFGQRCFVHIPREARRPGSKLLDRAEKAIIVGNGKSDKVYRVYIAERDVLTETRNIKLAPRVIQEAPQLEKEDDIVETFPSPPKATSETGEHPKIKPESFSDTTRQHELAPDRQQLPTQIVPTPTTTISTPEEPKKKPLTTRSGRQVKPSARSQESYAMAVQSTTNIPQSYKQAQTSPEWEHWNQAIQHELQAHQKARTWEDCPKPREVNIVDCRWVFARKYDATGNLVKYKARLVARGFTQTPGVDYDETYSPVARYDSLRLLLRFATSTGKTAYQMDFDTAYLNSPLKHLIYMRSPPGLDTTTGTVKLNRALYGLKQSGREWFGTLNTKLLGLGWKPTSIDPCVYVKTGNNNAIFLAIYVDDVVLIGDQHDLHTFQHNIGFNYKDLGEVRYLLGLEINRNNAGMHVTQTAYADRILERFNMTDSNPRQTPMDPNTFPEKFVEGSDEPTDQTEYQQIMGSLNFLAICTRPDLSFTVTALSSHNARPAQRHLAVVKQVLRYIKATRTAGITLKANADPSLPTRINMYTDASWGSIPDDARSVNGFILQIDGSTTAWSSKKQSCVARSTCEAEYMACSYAAAQLVWVVNAIRELFPSLTTDCRLLCDNNSAKDLMVNARINARSKHIAIHYHFVRELIGDVFEIEHVPTQDNLADVCTKSLPRPVLAQLIGKIMW